MPNKKLPDHVIDRICELRARDILHEHTDHDKGERWPYSAIQEDLDLQSDWPIGKYAGQAGLTSKVPEAERLRNAKNVLGIPVESVPEGNDTDPTGSPTESASGSSSDPASPPSDPDRFYQPPSDVDYESMPLDDSGVDGFLPDTTHDPQPPTKDPDTMPEEPPDPPSDGDESPATDERSVAFRYTCKGCGEDMKVYKDELGETVTCPWDECDRQVELPTHAQLVERGRVLS